MVLDALLAPTGVGTPFVFKEPLGQAREVKVALSGLFGRFVARAYLERYFNLSIFAHLGNKVIDLDRRRRIKIKRLSRGDLPDWVACAADLSSLTVAEAKGCHDVGGPAKALERAWKQAGRIDVTAQNRKVTVKRIAIATRWGVAAPKLSEARISVRDPIDEGEPLNPQGKEALFIGLLRLHIANLIKPLGHADLADALQRIARQPLERGIQEQVSRARTLLDAAPAGEVQQATAISELIGGIVTRAGPVASVDVPPAEQETLARLNLRPVFVGIERDLIRAAIDGQIQAVQTRLAQKSGPDDFARSDRAGGWIVPLGQERRIIGGT